MNIFSSLPPQGTPDGARSYRFHYFSELYKKPVCTGKIHNRIGRISDLVFRLSDPYPEAVGIFLNHGWGQPTEFVPWEKVLRIEDDAVFVAKPETEDGNYPPFVDQPGWILLDRHLMGRTILDMDGRRIEVVNDIHLLESQNRMLVVHVDISLKGFLRKLRVPGARIGEGNLIPWRYVQPLSVEDAAKTDTVSLSVTRNQLHDLPSEDIADALEELRGDQQKAFFSALDSEKAAEALVQAEPRAQRQLISTLHMERARRILSEMSVAQLADLFLVLPHDRTRKLLDLLPKPMAKRVSAIISERESIARDLVSHNHIAVGRETTVGEMLGRLRTGGYEHDSISYVYVVTGENVVIGVVDVRELLLAADTAVLGDIMTTPVVSAEEDDLREDLVDLFSKYHFRMIPVTDDQDHLLGIIHYNDIMKTTKKTG